MSTMVGMGPRRNVLSEEEEQPVYLLTRRRSLTPPAPLGRAPLASGVAEREGRVSGIAPTETNLSGVAQTADGRASGMGEIGGRASLASDLTEAEVGGRATLASEPSYMRMPVRRRERSTSSGSWRYATPLAPSDDAVLDLDDDDDADLRRISGAGRRQRAIRVLGVLAILGTLGAGAAVLQQPKVRREALSFVTMGHEEGAARLGRKIAGIVDNLRHR